MVDKNELDYVLRRAIREELAAIKNLIPGIGRAEDKRGYTVAEASDYLGISEWVLRAETRENRIVAKKRGTTTIYDRSELDRYFDSLPER